MSARGSDYRATAAANVLQESSSPKNQAILNPKTVHYEFFGPVGTFFITLSTPGFTYLLYFLCNHNSEPVPIYKFTSINTFCNWFAFLTLLWYIIPGRWIKGTELRTGEHLQYKMNGMYSFIIVICIVALGLYDNTHFLEFIHRDFLSLLTASLIFSTGLALWSHLNSIASKDHQPLLAEGGNSGNFFYDFWMGRNLNPRVKSFDIKVFCELRPGLFAWLILNVSFAAHQYNSFGRLSDSMILVCFFQAWYIFDSVYNEPAVLTTMDVTTDGFGFMLAFGDLCWVPFTYSLQARYLSYHPVHLGYWSLAILCIQLFGFYIFRGANSQKHRFRSDPNHASVKGLKYIQTSRGSRLLADGWWGTARHINYLGDWIMAWAWCLPTGFGNPITYFYVGYFAVLLLHRERRDEEKCALKYGRDWETYTKAVPWRIIPYVY